LGYVFAIWWCCNQNIYCILAMDDRLKTLTTIHLQYVLPSYINTTNIKLKQVYGTNGTTQF